MISITKWTRYEVDSRGDRWEPGAALRKGPLQYLRVTCNGAAWGLSYRRLLSVGRDDAAAAFGLYIKLLELAGSQVAELRGAIRNGDGTAASVEDIAAMTGFPLAVVARGLEILTSAGWVSDAPESPGNSGSLPEFRETSVPFLNTRQSEQSIKRSTAKSFADVSPPTSPHGEGDPSDLEADADPLLVFSPTLADFYPRLLTLIADEHPKARIPKAGSKADADARATLAKLAHRDGFPEGEIVAALEWLFTSEHKDAAFWRKQVAAVGPLRKVGSSGLSKFASIYEAWKRAAGAIMPGVEGADSWTGERIAEFERDLAEEQTTGATV